MSAPPANYRLFSALLAPALLGHACRRALQDGGWRYLWGRLGHIEPGAGGRPVWLHCASVGEVVTALPLLQALQAADIGPLVVSTNTPTGRQTAEQRAGTEVRVLYLPLDRPRPVRRFLDRLRPRAALILETELWPWLYSELRRREVPITLVNARLSARTLDAPRWWRRVAAWCLRSVDAVLARSAGDAEGFLRLGAAPERVRTIGDLKLAANDPAPAPVPLPRPFVLAASTHDDEERRLASAWRQQGIADALLVIVPRHPERGEAIARALAADGHTVARRSLDQPVTAATTIYLADTLGELTAFMAGAEVVVMGGSIIPHGGQNVLEPARAARAIVTGPHMENFREATERLAGAGGLRQCEDAAGVIAATRELLADPEARRRMGGQARAAVADEGRVAARYLEALSASLPALR